MFPVKRTAELRRSKVPYLNVYEFTIAKLWRKFLKFSKVQLQVTVGGWTESNFQFFVNKGEGIGQRRIKS